MESSKTWLKYNIFTFFNPKIIIFLFLEACPFQEHTKVDKKKKKKKALLKCPALSCEFTEGWAAVSFFIRGRHICCWPVFWCRQVFLSSGTFWSKTAKIKFPKWQTPDVPLVIGEAVFIIMRLLFGCNLLCLTFADGIFFIHTQLRICEDYT